MKPESRFTNSVNVYLKSKVYFEKMNNPFRAGTADFWYSGKNGDCWIEYKFIPTIPTRTTILPDLSARQLKWLNDRADEGRKVYVVVGHPKGGVVWPIGLDQPMQPAAFEKLSLTRPQLAAWILGITGESPCRSPKSCSPSSESCPPDKRS